MKKLLLPILFIGMSLATFAQMKQGTVNYSMTFTSDDPEQATSLAMMQGSKMTLSFKPGAAVVEVYLGMIGKMTTITEEKSGKMLLLMDMMGMKNAVKTDQKDLEKEKTETAEPKVTLVDETKEIAGYTCKKAVITPAEGDPVEVWYTEEISAYLGGQKYFYSKLPGMPMSYSMITNGLTLNFTVTDIQKTIDKEKFSMKIPEGFTEKTPEEMRGMMGQ